MGSNAPWAFDERQNHKRVSQKYHKADYAKDNNFDDIPSCRVENIISIIVFP